MRQHVFASGASLRSRSRALLCAAHGIARGLLTDKFPRIFAAAICAVLIASLVSPAPLGAAQLTWQQQQAAAKAAAEAAAKAAAKLAAQQAAAKAAAQAAAQAAVKAAQQAAAKAAQQAAAKAAAEAAARAAAQQQAAAKAAAERQRQQQQQQQQQAAAKAAAERQKQQQQQQQQAAAKAEAERQKQQQQQQQAAAKAEAERQKQQQQQQQAAAKAAAERQRQQQQQQAAAKAEAERQKQQQQQQSQKTVAVPQPPKPQQQPQHAVAAPTLPQLPTQAAPKPATIAAPKPSVQPVQKAGATVVLPPPASPPPTPIAIQPPPQAPSQMPPSAADPQQPATQVELDQPGQQKPTPPPVVKTQQAQIEELLRHAEKATSERRRQRRMLEELRRREAEKTEQQAPVVQLGESPAAAASAQAQQSAQIEEISQQLLRAELGRTEERKQIEELKRRQEQIIQAERSQPDQSDPTSTPGPEPNAMTREQAEVERLRQQAEISELQQKQENWDARRLARTKRIEELVELQKARAAGAEQRALADQDKSAVAPAQQLEIMQQQARRMALGHPDQKPAAPQPEPMKLDTAQPQPQAVPLTSEPPADGATPNTDASEAAKPGEAKPGASPAAPAIDPAKDVASDGVKAETPTQQDPGAASPPGQQGTTAPQPPAHEDGTKQDGATKEASTAPAPPSDGTKTPAVTPADNANTWRPQIVTAGDGNGVPGGKPEKPTGWNPEIVTAVVPSEGSPGTGSGADPQAPSTGEPARSQTGDAAPAQPAVPAPPSAPAKSSEETPAPAEPAAPPPKTANGGKAPAPDLRPAIPVAAVPSNEILAPNLSPEEIEKARALGLEPVTPSALPNLGMAVTRLKVPRGGNAAALSKKLTEQMPLTKFAVNHTYWIFGAARGGEDRTTAVGPSPGTESSGGCTGNKCFASTLINWQSNLRSCTNDVKVGIIDTSFDITHPAFKRLKRSSGEFLNGEAPSSHDWHGTAVLSLLAGDPASNTPGLIPDASFYLATAFKSDEAGNASTDTMRLLQALDWLDALDVRFINMSFSGPRDPLFEKAIERMHAKGVVFIAAAGNQGPTAPPSYPAAYPQVIAVTAVNKNAENYRHANRGPYVDLSAPGVEVMTALPDGKQGFRTGTSFAAPFVTAIIATRNDLSSLGSSKKGDLLGRLNLQDLGPPGRDPIYGQGLVLAPKNCSGSGGTVAHKEGPELPPKMSVGSAASIAW